MKKIAIIIADIDEYKNLYSLLPKNTEKTDVFGMESHKFVIKNVNGDLSVQTVCCGIGKVNAAVAGAFLVQNGFDLVVSGGLSGGLNGVTKNDIVVGNSYFEHDFDLTVLGYKPAQKPGQDYIYTSPEYLVKDIVKYFPFAKAGKFATGDGFVCSSEKRDFLVNEFDAIACDMETSAVAYACDRTGTEFVSIRMISDGADDEATESYKAVLNSDDVSGLWLKIIFNWLEKTEVIC